MLNNTLVALVVGVFLYLGSVFLTGCAAPGKYDNCTHHIDNGRNITVFICDTPEEMKRVRALPHRER